MGSNLVSETAEQGDDDKLIVPCVITNNIRQSIPGLLKLRVTDSENGTTIKSEDRELIVTFDKNIVAELDVPKDKRYDIDMQFIEGNTKKSVSIHKVTPYILTPLPPRNAKNKWSKSIWCSPRFSFSF